MPLTPADVHNVAFKKPPIGKRGYDEEEVDAFLDEVERELARLVEENAELRSHAGGGAPRPAGPSQALSHPTGEMADLRTQLDRLVREKAQAEQAAQRLQGEVEQLRAQGSAAPVAPGDGEQQALRVLMMAQRTADEHLADARKEADKMRADAKHESEEVTREARAKADALERDARQRHQEVMGGLETKRNALQKHLDELKQFEREYRTRLKAYLESQLRDLDGRAQSVEAETSRPTEVKAGNGLAAAAAPGRAGFPEA